MRSRLVVHPVARNWVLAVALVAGGLLPVAGPAPQACAGEGPRAALVVSTAEQQALRYCVELPDASVSGIELIELAGEQHGLSYRLGFGGEAVCMLAGVGPAEGECFAEHPNFWAYWRGDGSGGWSWSSVGAGSTSVGDGDVEGWSWGSGTTADTHPAPPPTTAVSVCPAPEPSPPSDPDDDDGSQPGGDPQPSGGGSPERPADEGDSGSGNAGTPDGDATQERGSTTQKERPGEKEREPERDAGERDRAQEKGGEVVATKGRRVVSASERPADPATDGPPAAALGALAAAGALAVARWVVVRRRRAGL